MHLLLSSEMTFSFAPMVTQVTLNTMFYSLSSVVFICGQRRFDLILTRSTKFSKFRKPKYGAEVCKGNG